MSKRRNPGLHYLGVVLITWPFVLYWTYRLTRSVASLTKEHQETVRVLFWLAVLTSLIVLAWILASASGTMTPNRDQWLPTAGINSAIASVGLVISILVILNRDLQRLEHKHHSILADLKVIFFSLLFFVSLPMLQKRVNADIEHVLHSSHSANKGNHGGGHEHRA